VSLPGQLRARPPATICGRALTPRPPQHATTKDHRRHLTPLAESGNSYPRPRRRGLREFNPTGPNLHPFEKVGLEGEAARRASSSRPDAQASYWRKPIVFRNRTVALQYHGKFGSKREVARPEWRCLFPANYLTFLHEMLQLHTRRQ
jgi:hypothetical protein